MVMEEHERLLAWLAWMLMLLAAGFADEGRRTGEFVCIALSMVAMTYYSIKLMTY
jgi:hypothetical protein